METEDGKTIKRTNRNGPQHMCLYQLFGVVIFAVGLTAGVLIGVYLINKEQCQDASVEKTPTQKPKVTTNTIDSSKGIQECPKRDAVSDSSYEDSLFAPLTVAEMQRVAIVMLAKNYINVGMHGVADLTDNFILYQNFLPPNKTLALSHLDSNGPHPGRFAKVTVQRGGANPPDLMEYKVGPLNSNSLEVAAMTQPGEITFNSRPYEFLEVPVMLQLLQPHLGVLAPLISESFDGAVIEDLSISLFNGPPSYNGTERETRWAATFKGFGDDELDLIHLLPLSGTIHNPGTNTSSWYAYDFHYLNQGPYATANDLMDAYISNKLRKVRLPNGYRFTLNNRVFPKRDSSLHTRKYANKPGPRTYELEGPRYDVNGSRVSWMDWEFDLSGGQTRGPALFNIKFKGQRIVYEEAVNDIALNYAMDSHGQNNIIYADATYGILGGDYPTTILPDVDCPAYGTVLNSSYWYPSEQQAYTVRAFCIYEHDSQEPLWRHVGSTYRAGLRNRYLVARSPTVIGNYDYIFEFQFHLDGKIFTKAKATGFIQASFWDENNPNTLDKSRDAFGYRLADFQTGPIHDHMFGFKVDMDIIDDKNSFKLVKWKSGTALEAIQTANPNITTQPPYFKYNTTRYLEWEKVKTELGISEPQDQAFMLVVNEKEKNKWGVEKGYQIAPLITGSQSHTGHPLLDALSFTKYHVAVTKRKEEERTLTSIYDVNRITAAKYGLDRMLNGEAIENEDLVNWVTIGFLHVPTSEDMPMTARVEAAFMLRPFNFFDRTAVFDMPEFLRTNDNIYTDNEPTHEPCFEAGGSG